jgi:ribonuclease E
VPDAVEQQQLPMDGLAEAPEARRTEEGDDRRERRSRDRYGRDRRERHPRDEAAAVSNEGAAPAQPDGATPTQPQEAASELPARPRYPTGFVSEEPAAGASEPKQAAPAPSRELPKVTAYELPVTQLLQVAEGSGLQWVNSDADKIAAAQAAMAAEPKPVRVPRERPPVIVLDEGPLVLVETKRDLRNLTLPFEQGSLPLQ